MDISILMDFTWFFATKSDIISSECQGNGFLILSAPLLTYWHVIKGLERQVYLHPCLQGRIPESRTCIVYSMRFFMNWYARTSRSHLLYVSGSFNFIVTQAYTMLEHRSNLSRAHWTFVCYHIPLPHKLNTQGASWNPCDPFCALALSFRHSNLFLDTYSCTGFVPTVDFHRYTATWVQLRS